MNADPWQQWQSFAAQFSSPAAGSAQRFMSAARAFLDAAAASPAAASPTAAAERARIFSDSVRDMFADVPQPWNLGFGGNSVNGGAAPASMLNSAALGATREHQQRWQRIAEASRRIEEAQGRLQRLWADAMREAAAAFAVQLTASHPVAASPEALRRLYDTWIDCAEDAYSRAAHSEAFCDTLAECMNASGEWRKEMQANVEHSAKLLDLPTRSEINTLSLRLQSVETELRALRNVRAPKKTKKPGRPKEPPPAKTRRARRKANR